MKDQFLSLFTAFAIVGILVVTPTITSQAAEASNPWEGTGWLIRGRVIGLIPDESDGQVGGASAKLRVDDAISGELDFSYFFTENIAAELVLTVTQHDVELRGVGKISEVVVLPPTLLLQYHHPMGAFKPYVGAGVNYTVILASDATAAIGGRDSWDDSIGFAVQLGFDYALNDHWSINVDAKRYWLNLDAKVGPARTKANVDVDPWLFGIGVGYRF